MDDKSKELMNELSKSNDGGRSIYTASLFKRWKDEFKDFDFKIAFELLMEKDNTGEWLSYAGEWWDHFDHERATKHLLKLANEKAPSSMIVQSIWRAGKDWKYNYFNLDNRAFDALKKLDKNGYWINEAGKSWTHFGLKFNDFFEALINADKTGKYIHQAGRDWPFFMGGFDYNRAFNELVKRDKIGKFIFEAGRDWKKFDYAKGFEALRNVKKKSYLQKAHVEWPKSAKEILTRIKKETKKIDKIKDKSLKLENVFEENYVMDPREKKILSKIGKADDGGRTIYSTSLQSGRSDHKYFNHKLAFELLLQKDNTGYYTSMAGSWWGKGIDHKKGMDHILKLANKENASQDTAEAVLNTGRTWENLTPTDFNNLLEALIKTDKSGKYIYDAGIHWKEFDYKRGFYFLKKISPNIYFKKAKEYWPKSAKEMLLNVKKEIEHIDKTKDKTLKLEDVFMELHNGR